MDKNVVCGTTEKFLRKCVGFRLKSDVEQMDNVTDDERETLLKQVHDDFGV